MKLSGITTDVLKKHFIITDEECAIILPIITNENKLKELANLMASKFDSLKDFLEEGDYEKIFSGALNKLEKMEYITIYIIATSDECIESIKNILSTKDMKFITKVANIENVVEALNSLEALEKQYPNFKWQKSDYPISQKDLL